METKILNIGISKISALSFSMTAESLKIEKGQDIGFDIAVSFTTPDEGGNLNFIIELNVVRDSTKKIKIANLKVQNVFTVMNSANYIFPPKMPGGPPEIDSILVKFCLENAMAQTRGVWAAKTEGTPLEIVVVPLTNSDDMVLHMQGQAAKFK